MGKSHLSTLADLLWDLVRIICSLIFIVLMIGAAYGIIKTYNESKNKEQVDIENTINQSLEKKNGQIE